MAEKTTTDPLAEDDPLEAALQKSLEEEYAGVLTPAEIQAARQEAQKRLSADAKKKAKDDIIAGELRRHRLKTGDGYLDEDLFVQIDLPPYADRIVVDGETFFNGHMYKRARHIVNSLRETMARAWDHEADIKGQSMQQKIGQYRVQHFDKMDGSKTISAKAA